ncbi:hypothetical protein E2C01_008140 [Portunus trituberculatus]|uniref:Uncharacterized protein n=1 Tax=Portunus trituberculatus TaxID=210409 RepID=A0A5B7D567_PORTR|nr:hypothetical protein [Portunus trituberculatus]
MGRMLWSQRGQGVAQKTCHGEAPRRGDQSGSCAPNTPRRSTTLWRPQSGSCGSVKRCYPVRRFICVTLTPAGVQAGHALPFHHLPPYRFDHAAQSHLQP